MAQNYTRQSSFADGDTVTAALFNNEYNQIVNAFAYSSSSASSTGHRHDGTAGQGGNVPQIGDLDFLNKVVVDGTNNRVGFFVEVSSSAVEQVRVQDGAIVPVTDNDIDLGTSSLEFKDGYFDGTVHADAINFNGTAITATAAELNIMDGVTSTAAEINLLDGVTATTTELNYTDTGAAVGVVVASKVVTADANKDVASFRNITLTGELDAGSLDISGDADIDGTLETDALSINGTAVTSTAAELNILDGVTATATELNYSDTGQATGTVVADKVVTVDSNKDVASFRNITLTGELDAGSLDISGNADIDGTLETDALSINGTTVTSTAAELNILDGVTATAAELNILDGVTVTAAEINTLDGITAVLGELNALDLGSTAVGTAVASKAVILDSNKDYTGIRNFTITGELDAATLDISGDADIDGTTNLDVVDIDGALTQDGGAVFNEASADVDFRVESNDNANMLFVDGGNNRVGIGTSSPSSYGHSLVIAKDAAGGATYATITNTNANQFLNLGINADVAEITWDNADSLAFGTTAASTDEGQTLQAMLINSSGNVGIGTSSPFGRLSVDVVAGAPASSGNMTNGFTVHNSNGGRAIQLGVNETGSYNYLQSAYVNNANVAVDMAFFTGATERFRIASDGSLSTLTLGTSNVRFGVNAGNSITSGGNFNVVVGDEAGTALTTGDNNVALGFEALKTEDTSGSATAIGYQALRVQNSGGSNSHNSAVGAGAGTSITTGNQNTIFGSQAADALTDADFNVAVGYAALGSDTLGSKSTAIGYGALDAQNFTTATDSLNVAVGHNAGGAVTTGVQQVLIGANAGDSLTAGDANTAVGYLSLSADTLGSHNVAIGRNALKVQNFTTATDVYNVAVGSNAGAAVTTGVRNTLIGGLSGDALTSGNSNVAVGYASLSTDTLGDRNVAIGFEALTTQNFTTTTDSYNTAVGHSAGKAITTGANNTLIGALAGDALTDSTQNTAMGYGALSADTRGRYSTAFGYLALQDQNLTTTTNTYNVAVGHSTGKDITTGIENTLVGARAGDALTDADFNVALGYFSLSADTLGSQSTAIGYATLANQNFTTATTAYNVAVGAQAGNDITTGVKNTLIGGLAGDAMTTGDENTFLGYSAGGTGVVTGDNNTAVGRDAGNNLTSGSNNLLLGHDSGVTGSPGGNINNESNEIVFGDENISEAHIQVSLTVASDERDKTDFVDLDLGLNFVKALEPVTYYWDKRSKYGDKYAEDYDLNAQTPDGTHKEDWMDIGFKAQSVQALEEAAGYKIADKKNLTVSLSGDGKQYGLRYEKFIPILVKAIKDQDAIITALTARVAALES